MKEQRVHNRSIVYSPGTSFIFMPESELVNTLHCHPAFELIVIEEGSGMEYIGDAVRKYDKGDIIFLGENLPHLYLPNSKDENRCSILQFPKSLFPSGLSDISEFAAISNLFGLSDRGVLFKSKSINRSVRRLLDELSKQNGLRRVNYLYNLLDYLGKTHNYTQLSALQYHNPMNSYSLDDPVALIHSYLINNHKTNITLADIASATHLNVASICRTFKQRTGKTIFQVLAGIRIEYACKLLATTSFTVSQIAYESGFGNQAHFNKQFLQITGQTPSDYRAAIHNNHPVKTD